MRLAVAALALGLTGCSYFAPAPYPAPDGEAAKAAYIRSITDDVLYAPLWIKVERGLQTRYIKQRSVIRNGKEKADIDLDLADALQRLRQTRISDCAWDRVTGRRIPDTMYNRMKEVNMAYYCHFTNVYTVGNGKQYSEDGAGYFHRDSKGWVFTGPADNGPAAMVHHEALVDKQRNAESSEPTLPEPDPVDRPDPADYPQPDFPDPQ